MTCVYRVHLVHQMYGVSNHFSRFESINSNFAHRRLSGGWGLQDKLQTSLKLIIFTDSQVFRLFRSDLIPRPPGVQGVSDIH